MSDELPSTSQPPPDEDLKRIARRAERNVHLRLRLGPEPKTKQGQIEAALERMRRVVDHRRTLDGPAVRDLRG